MCGVVGDRRLDVGAREKHHQADEAEGSSESIEGRKIGKADQSHYDECDGHDQPHRRPEPRQDLVEAGEESHRQSRTVVLCLIAQDLNFSPQLAPIDWPTI